MAVRLVRALYARPKRWPARPDGGLDLHGLVGEAQQVGEFVRLFGESASVAEIVECKAQRLGWCLPRAAVIEAMEECL